MESLDIHNTAQNIFAKKNTWLLAIAISNKNYLPHLGKCLNIREKFNIHTEF